MEKEHKQFAVTFPLALAGAAQGLRVSIQKI